MWWLDLLFALITAVILTAVYAAVARPTRFSRILTFAGVVFLGSWAGGLWVSPVGHQLWGVYWLAFFWVGLLVALMMAAGTFRIRGIARRLPESAREDLTEAVGLGVFLWLVIVGFALSIAARYIQGS